MQFSQLHYLPLAPLFFAVLIGIFFLVLLLIQLGILRYAYMRLGVSSTGAFMLLAASLLGSYFNIPVWHLTSETVSAAREIDFFGVRYVARHNHCCERWRSRDSDPNVYLSARQEHGVD